MFPVNIIANQRTDFMVLVLAPNSQKSQLKQNNFEGPKYSSLSTVKLFLDLPKPVRIHQPGDPEDSTEEEPPDVSHTAKDRNKVIRRQLNYTWLPTPIGKNLKGIISPASLENRSMAGFTNLQKQFFCLPTSFVQHSKDKSSPHSPASVTGGKHITLLFQMPLLGMAREEGHINPVHTVLLV